MATTPAAPTSKQSAPRLGTSLIEGRPAAPGADVFRAIDPSSGENTPVPYTPATSAEVDRAARSAWDAFYANAPHTPAERAAFLESCASELAALGDELIDIAHTETGLAPARLVSERERTIGTLKMFAALVREGSWVRASIDHGDGTRRPIPRPDVRRMLRPLGPVAVFGASNFPLAYSTAGGDTASALAAGCPVIVKGHPAHPGTGELAAHAILAAVRRHGLHAGTFAFLHAGGARELVVGQELVRHPSVRAVGFTGSHAAGMVLARECAARTDPIPLFAEMGSVNPIFILPYAAETQSKSIADRLFTSITNSGGQMCTCPGLIIARRSDGLEALLRSLSEAMNAAGPITMLSRRVRAGFIKRLSEISSVKGVEIRAGSPEGGHRAASTEHEDERGFPVRGSGVLLRCTFATFRSAPTLLEECFGPAATVVVCESDDDLLAAATLIRGSLTGSIFAGGPDGALALKLQTVLEQRVGRLVFNGVPTGVEVCASMVHGGPYPATNQPNSTAVGGLAIERWCRPLAYQSVPEQLLPQELREDNPLGISRVVDGVPRPRA